MRFVLLVLLFLSFSMCLFRILHMNGFDETELINFRYLVYANIITCLHQLISGVKQIHMQISDQDRVSAIGVVVVAVGGTSRYYFSQ